MRIAWFTPFNDRSAIAEFSAQIALALSMTADVEIWTNEISPMSSSIPTINYRHAQPNLDTLNQYDIAVYNFGNYLAYHDTIYEVSKQRRGLVILHDRVMQHFFAGYHFVKQRNPQAYLDMMRRFYGWKGYLRAKAGVDGNKPGIWDDDLEVGRYPLFEECIVNAEGVVVHSSSQARLVRDGWCGPVRALHFPSYAGNLAAAPDPGVRATNRERLTILTIGHGNRNKRIHEVIRVLGEDQALARRSRYVVIGPIESSYRAELMHLIDRYSLADSVDLMGYQPDDILRRYVAMSDVFVNLRLPSMEGGSASLMLEMAAGGPVIVYDVGVFAELPEGTVIKVNPSAPEGLHVALDRLLSSADLRVKVGTAARAFAVKWNEKRYAQEFLSFIDEVKSWRPLLTLSDTVAGHIRWMGFGEQVDLGNQMAREICGLFSTAVSERLTPDQCKVRIDATIPASFICGKLTLLDCTVQNVSDTFLCSELPYPVHLSYRWKSTFDSTAAASGDGNRTRLPCMMAPGLSTQCRMEVLAPDAEGEFEIIVTLVQESVAWFNDIDASNAYFAKVKVVRADSSDSLESRTSLGSRADSILGEELHLHRPLLTDAPRAPTDLSQGISE